MRPERRPIVAYIGDILERSRDNTSFREVVATAPHSQVVVMSIPPGGDIGLETHTELDQVLVIVEGGGVVVLDLESRQISAGTLIQVPAGTRHNVTNTGTTALRLYTVYAPPAHAPGTIHRTKAEADLDEADHPMVGVTS
jgi:mannose-6-phosphate isomerase-like protein (cupin superfamily)